MKNNEDRKKMFFNLKDKKAGGRFTRKWGAGVHQSTGFYHGSLNRTKVYQSEQHIFLYYLKDNKEHELEIFFLKMMT